MWREVWRAQRQQEHNSKVHRDLPFPLGVQPARIIRFKFCAQPLGLLGDLSLESEGLAALCLSPGEAEAAVKVISSPWVTTMCQSPLVQSFSMDDLGGCLGTGTAWGIHSLVLQSSSSVGTNPAGVRTQHWLHSVPGDSHQPQTASGRADPFSVQQSQP